MENAIRWMISATGLITGGIVLVAACIAVYVRIRYVERRIIVHTVHTGIDTDTAGWLNTAEPAPIERPSRPTTLEEWLAWDYVSEAAADLFDDTAAIERVYTTMGGAQVARYQWAIARLGTTETALKEDTAEYRIHQLREEVAEIRSELVPV